MGKLANIHPGEVLLEEFLRPLELTANECKSDNIYILRASPDIENASEIIANKSYSDIYVTYASNELVDNIKSQFGERMSSLTVDGITPMWQIVISDN